MLIQLKAIGNAAESITESYAEASLRCPGPQWYVPRQPETSAISHDFTHGPAQT